MDELEKQAEDQIEKLGEGLFKAIDEIRKLEELEGKIECPICRNDLFYTKNSKNRHIWGKCKNPDCLKWMQ